MLETLAKMTFFEVYTQNGVKKLKSWQLSVQLWLQNYRMQIESKVTKAGKLLACTKGVST